MPKFGELISLSTTAKFAGGILAGSAATVGVQYYKDSSEFSKDPQIMEKREDQKKMSFEIQQLSKELEEKKRNIEMQEQSVARKLQEVGEKEEALRRMQQAITETQGLAAGVVAVETVQQVAQAEEPADKQPEEPKPDVVPANNAPRRPAVFDGGGNKEKTNDKQNNDSKPSVAFGSSGDVVTIEKGGAVPDAETERLRKEVENLRRRLAGDASKEKELREWEERVRERERALSEKLWKRNVESKATQTDDPLFEAAFGGSDPFDKPSSGTRANQLNSLKNIHPVVTAKAKTKTTSKKISPFASMGKEEVRSFAINEVDDTKKAIDALDSTTLEKITGKVMKTEMDQQKMIADLKGKIAAAVMGQGAEVLDYSIDQVLEGHVKRSEYEKKIEILHKNIPFTKSIKTASGLQAVAEAMKGTLDIKNISPEMYAKLLMKSTDEAGKNLKNLPAKTEDEIEEKKTKLQEILERREMLRENVDEILKTEPEAMTVDEGLKKLNNTKAESENIVKSLYKKDGKGLLEGFEKIQNDWKRVVESSEKLYPPSVPPMMAPPPFGGSASLLKIDGLPSHWVDDLRAVDEDFKKKDDENTKKYDDALKPYHDVTDKINKCFEDKTTMKTKFNVATKALNKAKREGRDEEEIKKLQKSVNDLKAERDRLEAEYRNLLKERSNVEKTIQSSYDAWKDYRQAAHADKKKQLLVTQKRWLEVGLEDQSKIDYNAAVSRKDLDEDTKKLSASDVKRLRALGKNVSDSVFLTEEEKKTRRQFIDEVKTCEKQSEALRNKYKAAVLKKEALEHIEITPVSNDRYNVSLRQLSVFGSPDVYACLTAVAPYIEELTIEDFDSESAGTPFLNFAILCRRFKNLKKLSIKGIFGATAEEKWNGTRVFFDALNGFLLPENFKKAQLSMCGEERFFDVISLIPDLKIFEMYSKNRNGALNGEDASIERAERVYAAVASCEEVVLPNVTSIKKIEFFDYLTDNDTLVKKHLKLYTDSFGGMMRTEGFPEALYRLLKSGKATVEWLGNLEVGNICPYTDNEFQTLAIPENKKSVTDVITQTFKDQKVDGKCLNEWAGDANFSENFLKNPEVYLKLSGTHSKEFKHMLVEYNENELNPLFMTCKKIAAIKKTTNAKSNSGDNVYPKDPLASILKQYPILKGDGVAFDGIRPTTDGSILRKVTLPALLNLVLRERINGKSHIVLAVEDGIPETEEYVDEVTGKAMKKNVEGKFISTLFWYFPSIANSLWEKEDFAVSSGAKNFVNLSKEAKDDLKMKMMDASCQLQNKIDTSFNYESATCRLDPKIGRECLKKVNPKSIFYWNYFSGMMQTGKLTVATDAPADKRTLFEIFSKVANAQSIHEKLYEAYEKLYVVNEKLRPVKQKIAELEDEIATYQASGDTVMQQQQEQSLLKKEDEAAKITQEFDKYNTEMETCANSLLETRKFLEEKLPYLKEIAKNIDGFGGNKKPAPGSNPTNTNPTTNVNPTGTTTTTNPVPKKLANPFSNNTSNADVAAWIKGGKKVKYKEAGKANILWDVLPATHAVCLAIAGIVSPAGIAPDLKAVEKAVNDGFLKVEHNGIDYYVILTVQEVVP